MRRYSPKSIEPKWQKTWEDNGTYHAVDFDKEKPKYVMLTEFPYPSGSGMHIGHMREYTLGDVIARQKRMLGFNVLYPMGYDAFGLPTENYAIKNKVTPQKATEENINNFQKQLVSMGFSFDWSRSIKTTDPNYYKWTQWLFLRFFKQGMAYQAEIAVNWCPFCKTGLSNEEVVNGRHERCDTPVDKKLIKQWVLRITDYAERLIEGLNDLDYPKWIAEQQINWIGRSKGAEIDFKLEGHDESIKVFTTRPDTIYGATFMVLAPEHPLVGQITTEEQKVSVNTYVREAASKSDLERQESEKDKSGVFVGAYVINPASGERIPVWIADYILMGYGTGAIMAVPAHDDRDFAFATKYGLPIKYVVEPEYGDSLDGEIEKEAVVAILRDPETDEVLMLDWGPRKDRYGGMLFIGGGLDTGEDIIEGAKREITEETGYVNVRFNKGLPFSVHSHYYSNVKNANYYAKIHGVLFDLVDHEKVRPKLDEGEKGKFKTKWLPISKAEPDDEAHRQVFLSLLFGGALTKEGLMANSGKYDRLPSSVMRDKVIADLTSKGLAYERINYRLRDWIFSRQRYWGEPIPIIHCEKHGAVAVPDKDLPVKLPNITNYEPTHDGESPLASATDWVNTICPQCGGPARRETDTMPNWAGSSWYYLRYFDPKNSKQFASLDKLKYWQDVDLYLGGTEHITLHLLYSRFWHQFFFDLGLVPTPEPYKARRSQGIILAADGTKMSKSRGNIVDPTEVIDSGYGADALRLAVIFLAPYDQTTPWSPESLGGTFRFLQRVWNLVQEYNTSEGGTNESNDLKRVINRVVKRVSQDLLNLSFNTAIAGLMECVNDLYALKAQDSYSSVEWQWALETLAKLLAPFAPHMAEEVWEQLGGEQSIHLQEWPGYDDKFLVSDRIVIAVQVNGKLRGDVEVGADADQQSVEVAAKSDPKISRYLEGKVEKVIFVPGRIINFLVK